jgi:ferredoxin-type protein NapG
MDQAITIVYSKNDRTGKHAYLTPHIDSDICTGCGLCERACVTQKASITILPRELVLGKAGDHYVKGWDKKDEARVQNATAETTTTKISEEKAIDSLNDMGDLLDD